MLIVWVLQYGFVGEYNLPYEACLFLLCSHGNHTTFRFILRLGTPGYRSDLTPTISCNLEMFDLTVTHYLIVPFNHPLSLPAVAIRTQTLMRLQTLMQKLILV